MKKGALLESLETVLVVTMITMLIWLYAEGETIITQSRTVTVRFVPPTTDLVAITIPDQEPGTTTLKISAKLQASSGDWKRISDWLRNNTIEIDVDAPTENDEGQTLNLLEALNNSPLAELRAFVKEVSPPTLTVRVQALEIVEMGLIAEYGDLELSTEPSEEPTFFPSKVRVILPSNDAAYVRQQNLKLTAHLDRLDRSLLKEGTQQKASVELSLPTEIQNTPHITLDTDFVDATFILDERTRQIDLQDVQVRLNISDDLSGKYKFTIDEKQRYIPVVTLKGPEEIINGIEKQASQEIPTGPDLVRAQITIKYSNLEEPEPFAAPLYIDVPDGVTLVSPLPNETFISYTATELNPQP